MADCTPNRWLTSCKINRFRNLDQYIAKNHPDGCSVGRPIRRWKLLDEIQAGICDGLTYREVRSAIQDICSTSADKLRYGYPQGESYEDVVQRLDPLILALEHRREPVLVVAHQAILRAVYGYFTNKERTSVPYIRVPLHTLIYLRPSTYGCGEMKFSLPPHLEAHH